MSVDIAQLGFRVESLEAEVAAQRLERMSKSAKKAENAADRLARSADKVGRSMQKMGRSMSMYITAPLLAAAGASVKLGIEFESTLAKMNTLVGVSRKELVQFRKEILNLAPSVGRGPRELADALFAITSAGQRGAKAMDTLKKAAQASSVGLGDTRTIALAATAAVQAYGEANMNSTKSLEILIGTIEQGNLEASSLAPVLGRVVGMAAELGVKFEDLGAFIAVFTRLGVNAEEAATSLRSTLATIQAPTDEATDALVAMGTSIEEVRKNVKEKGFIDTFQELVQRSREFNVDLVSIVPNVRALSGVLGVFGGEGKVAREVLEGVSAAVGTLGDRVQAVEDLDPAHQINKMKAELEALMIQLSEDLVPIFLDFVNSIAETVRAFKELDPETQKTIIRIIEITALVGPLLLLLSALANVIGKIAGAMALASGATAAGALKKSFMGIIRFLVGPVGLIALMGVAIYEIGESYVRAIENAIGRTNAFKSALHSMDIDKVSGAIKEVSAQLEYEAAQLEMWREKLASAKAMLEIPSIMADEIVGQSVLNTIILAEAEIEQLSRQVNHLTELLEYYEDKLGELTDAQVEQTAATIEQADAVETMLGLTQDEADTLAELKDKLKPAEKAMRELVKARKLLAKAAKAGDLDPDEYRELLGLLNRSKLAFDALGDSLTKIRDMDPAIARELEANMQWLDQMQEMDGALRNLESAFDPLTAGLKDLADARAMVQEAFDKDFIDEAAMKYFLGGIDEMEVKLRNSHDTMSKFMSETMTALQDVANLFHEDSAEAEALRGVMQILNVVMGIHAVIKQLAEGDVYSAIPRAIGVAAMIASMGVQTGASGSSSPPERTRQESQGTGSVLGDAEAKSESILKAAEITADATSELVGINRGMLHALQNLQTGLSGAVVQLARDSDADLSMGGDPTSMLVDLLTGGGLLNLFGLNFIGDWLTKIFGGKKKLLDEGIQIEGGMLSDLINDVLVRAFIDLKVKKHIFDDYDFKTKYGELDEGVGRQLALVFESIYSTVEQAAIALGIPLDVIQERLETFRIETQKISFKDLTADEQREELLAVFSKIFDDLALHVIPFIGDFQKVGEGLGETLVRVATSVQIFQEAVTALGFSVDDVGPEMFAEMAVGLVELTGGVENFIAMFSTFFDTFANDEQKLAFATSQLTRAFESVGLTIPETRDGMIDLMRSLDATTEAGREQIAMLLEIAGVADDYFDLLEKVSDTQEDIIQDQVSMVRQWRLTIAAFLGESSGLRTLTNNFEEAMKAADALGASQKEYALIARAFNNQLRRLAAELTLSVLDMTKTLFGDATDPIDDGLRETREVANSVFEEWQRALEDIYEFSQSILLNENLTTLTPAEQLAEAQTQFDTLLQAALAGDVEAAQALPEAAQALLEEARFMYASGQQYQNIFDDVLAALDAVGMPSGISPTITEEDDLGETITEAAKTAAEILAERLERMLLAMNLAETLRDLSQVLGVDALVLAAELGVPIRELVEILGVELGVLNATTAQALGEAAQLLGVDVFDLMNALGVPIEELARASGVHLEELSTTLAFELSAFSQALGANVLDLAGLLDVSLEELALVFGVGVENFSAEQFTALVEFSKALGAGISDVAEELRINLGKIEDANSLLSQSMDLAIADLPPEIQDELGPLLEDIRNATTEADANLAINNLGRYITSLPADLGAVLMPFLQFIGYQLIAPELEALVNIQMNTYATVRAIANLGSTITAALAAQKYKTTVPKQPVIGPLAEGGLVDKTGPYQMHAGEFVVTASKDNLSIAGGENLSSAELTQIKTVLVDIREQQRRYQEEDARTSKSMESSLKTQAEQQRRANNG